MVHLSRKRFEQVVTEALKGIPAELRGALDNIEVAVEEWPSPEQLADAGLDDDDLLFGFYHGTPLPERSPMVPYSLPDLISIFQGPLEEACESEDELRVCSFDSIEDRDRLCDCVGDLRFRCSCFR